MSIINTRSGKYVAAAMLLSSVAAHASALSDLWGRVQNVAGKTGSSLANSIASKLPQKDVFICVGYGKEKETWLQKEKAAFSADPAYKHIKIELVGTGSVDGVRAITDNHGRLNSTCQMTAFSPASSVYGNFIRQSVLNKSHADSSILNRDVTTAAEVTIGGDSLVRIPLVLVVWESQLNAMIENNEAIKKVATKDENGHYTVDAKLAAALAQNTNFKNLIAMENAENSDTTFAMANPIEANSGFVSLLLSAYEFNSVGRSGILNATHTSLENSAFWEGVRGFYQTTTGEAFQNADIGSTGDTLKTFIKLTDKGKWAGVVSYENIALEAAIKTTASDQPSNLRVIYFKRNVLSDNPFYVLNTAWNTPDQVTAAAAFLAYLKSPEAQIEAVKTNLRPGVDLASVASELATGPFVSPRAKEIGIQLDPPVKYIDTDVPDTVITNLLQGYPKNVTAKGK